MATHNTHGGGSTSDPPRVGGGMAGIFNRVAGGYDKEALRFFAFAADWLVAYADLKPGDKVLDVATGTAAVAIAAAQAVGPKGRVVAIDTAEKMLDQAQAKLQKFGLSNADLHVMDAEQLEFRSGYFDAVICSHALVLLQDMATAMRGWARVVKPGGVVAFSSFGAGAFQPMATLLCRHVADSGIPAASDANMLTTQRLADRESCLHLMQTAGLVQCEVIQRQLGYHLSSVDEWWDVVCNSEFRSMLEHLEAKQIDSLKERHLAEVSRLAGAEGLWMDVETLFSRGRKP